MRSYFAIIAVVLFSGCGLSSSDAVRVTNVSGAVLEIADSELADAIVDRTSGGESVPAQLVTANDALQRARGAYQVMYSATQLWVATDDKGSWPGRAACVLESLVNVKQAFEAANIKAADEISGALSLLQTVAEGECRDTHR
jgi:hypothetical protein